MKKPKNIKIDTALDKLMARIDDADEKKRLPPDTAIKVLNAAIAWEKVKSGKMDGEAPFNPDSL